MNPKENPNAGVQMLLALRKETDALQVITEYLKVKEMGPSDHIRTKHEAKAFIESGDVKIAEELVKSSQNRHAAYLSATTKMVQDRSQGMHQ